MIKTKALVLREYIIGESDKYVTLFTKEYGKIQVLAPKAKRADRGLASSTQLFVYGDFILTSFNDTYRLINVDIIEMFHDIRNSIETLSYASYFMEYLQAVTQPMLPQTELLQLGLMALKALTKEESRLPLIRSIFEIRSLKALGLTPNMQICTECGQVLAKDEQATYYFSAEAGGTVCKECKKNCLDIIEMGYGSYYTINYILTAPIKQLFYFSVTPPIEKTLKESASRLVAYYIDKHFKTLDFLETIEGMN